MELRKIEPRKWKRKDRRTIVRSCCVIGWLDCTITRCCDWPIIVIEGIIIYDRSYFTISWRWLHFVHYWYQFVPCWNRTFIESRENVEEKNKWLSVGCIDKLWICICEMRTENEWMNVGKKKDGEWMNVGTEKDGDLFRFRKGEKWFWIRAVTVRRDQVVKEA